MLCSSNFQSLIAANKLQVGVSKKRKAEPDGDQDQLSAAASSHANAGASGQATVTPCLAIDCEFVGIGTDGTDNALARVSIVNFHAAVVYDKYVKPVEPVTDYRTEVSGIRPQHIHGKSAITFKQCQREVSDLIKEKILVGHAVHNDLQVLLLSHPKHLIRDTSKYKGLCPDRPRSLKKLVAEVLQQTIQRGEHNSVEDARATLALYKHVRVKWEKELFDKKKHAPHSSSNKSTSDPITIDSDDDSPSSSATGASRPTAPSSASSTVTHPAAKKAKFDPIAVKLEAKKQSKIERNQRRKKMRTEQKREKQNR